MHKCCWGSYKQTTSQYRSPNKVLQVSCVWAGIVVVLQAGANIAPREGDELTRLPFLRTWFRTRSAIVMHLSNGTLQVGALYYSRPQRHTPAPRAIPQLPVRGPTTSPVSPFSAPYPHSQPSTTPTPRPVPQLPAPYPHSQPGTPTLSPVLPPLPAPYPSSQPRTPTLSPVLPPLPAPYPSSQPRTPTLSPVPPLQTMYPAPRALCPCSQPRTLAPSAVLQLPVRAPTPDPKPLYQPRTLTTSPGPPLPILGALLLMR